MTVTYAEPEVTSDPRIHAEPAVNCWDEFSPLEEILVGTADNARVPELTDVSAWMACYPTCQREELETIRQGRFPDRVIDESNEDLAILRQTLEELGVTVHQPAAVDHSRSYTTLDWSAAGYLSYCPRDITLILGSTIIETASPMRNRYFELFPYRELFQDYMRRGAQWIAAPKPRLSDDLYGLDADGLPYLREAEPVFDAANVFRVGRDLFYQVSRSGNEMGLAWLRSTCRLIDPSLRIHPIRGVYGYTHIDSTFAVLRPGLVLVNPARVSEAQIPKPFRNWEILWCPEIEGGELAFSHALSEPWISMNLLMVRPDLAIVDGAQPKLLRALESKGIETIPLELRHARVLGGGFHCVTLDIRRQGGLEDYMS